MSQLKTNAIRHTSATSDAITLASDGTATAKLTNTQPGSKNIIINGSQMIDQRNSGSSVTMSSSATFITDRFKCWEDTDGGLTAQQISDAPAGFKRSLKFTVTSADSSIGAAQYAMLRYPIEGYDMEDQNWGTSSAGTLTLSFWVKCSVTGTFGGGFVNSSDDRSYPFTYTVSSADTWEKKTVTVAGDQTGTWNAGNSTCCNIHWSLGIGSNSQGTAGQWQAGNKYTASGETALIANNGATWQITGIQFERGTRATEFEHRSYADELARCQRYFWMVADGSLYTTKTIGVGFVFSSSSVKVAVMYPVTMRTEPALYQVTATDAYQVLQPGPTFDYPDEIASFAGRINMGEFELNDDVSGLTAGQACMVRGNASGMRLGLNAEL